MAKIDDLIGGQGKTGYIVPLFWQHGEEEAVLLDEIGQMHKNGIDGFIVESRPHPDFLGGTWWRDFDAILGEAKTRGMKVWIFDDSAFPSGFAAGRIRDRYPQYTKRYLAQNHIDAVGPLAGSSFLVGAWIAPGEELVGAVAAKRTDGEDGVDGSSLLDLAEFVHDGILYWDVPQGNWRVFILKSTGDGGERLTRDYVNPLDAAAVSALIGCVYEEFWSRYSSEFGKTIAGFFMDEPRFGNAPSYNAGLGRKWMEYPYGGMPSPSGDHQTVLPFAADLIGKLDARWNGSVIPCLPLLWYEGGDNTHRLRYLYMDEVSRAFSENYILQAGEWCRGRGVKLIGHVVEDNGAHARLGFGSGHFFRSVKGFDYSGLDIVYQVWPGYTSGKFASPFSALDADFFYWGIAKMASSAGHLDPKKGGITACEIFGAYGWQEGLKLMKWLTDHACVRGVNLLIPHAFSPRAFDEDCPPHFYSRGANPQWRYFKLWSAYANHVCSLLTGGIHVAPVAVLYHAEAEWAGGYMPFEKAVKALMAEQIDCDVVCIDALLGLNAAAIHKGSFELSGERFKALVIPYSQRLPGRFLEKLAVLLRHEIPVFFIGAYPEGSSGETGDFADILQTIGESGYASLLELSDLPRTMKTLGLIDIEAASPEEDLRYYRYRTEGGELYFFTNESRNRSIHTTVRLHSDGTPYAYDAMENRKYALDFQREPEGLKIGLRLDPYESVFVLLGGEEGALPGRRPARENMELKAELNGNWSVGAAEAAEYPRFQKVEAVIGPGNAAVPGKLPDFSGTLRYETEFDFHPVPNERIYLDLGEAYEVAEVWVNGIHGGAHICPPYVFDITGMTAEGKNALRVDVTNTLAKKAGCNAFDRAMPQEPSGLIGPVRILAVNE